MAHFYIVDDLIIPNFCVLFVGGFGVICGEPFTWMALKLCWQGLNESVVVGSSCCLLKNIIGGLCL